MSNHRSVDPALDADGYGAMFAALANPNRFRLLLRIIDQCGPDRSCASDGDMGACVGDLADGVGIAPSTVSHHLKELRQAGLISMTRNGRTVTCAVNSQALDELSTVFTRAAARQPA